MAKQTTLIVESRALRMKISHSIAAMLPIPKVFIGFEGQRKEPTIVVTTLYRIPWTFTSLAISPTLVLTKKMRAL
jgi:hypothetical protein